MFRIVYKNLEQKTRKSLGPLSKDVLKKYLLNDAKDKIVKFIDHDNTPALLFVYRADQGSHIIKIEINYPPETTIKEIQWYKVLDRKINFVPSYYGGIYNDSIAIYELDFLESYLSLEKLFINHNLSTKQVIEYLSKSVEIIFKLFNSNQIRTVSVEKGEELYQRKIFHRLSLLPENPWIKQILHRKQIIINHKEYPGIPYILDKIEQVNFKKYFTPRKWGFIHGDFHFGNMLVKDNAIKLVDPNGGIGMPIEYDLGKLLHSFHGLYNHIQGNKFSLKYNKRDCTYYFHIDCKYCFWSDPKAIFPPLVSDNMFMEALFSECCHFLTMLPHHIQGKNKFIALYLRTLELFNFFFELI